MGSVAGGGWPAGVRVVLAVVVGWRFDRQLPRQGALLGPPAGPHARRAWEGLLGHQERASATPQSPVPCPQQSEICVPRPFDCESMHYRLFRPDEAGLSLLMSDTPSAERCPVTAGAIRA
jgi:hypothetical protein